MIEELMTLIIKELGPTGILICGLYFLLGKSLKEIAKSMAIINHELGEIKTIIKNAYDREFKE